MSPIAHISTSYLAVAVATVVAVVVVVTLYCYISVKNLNNTAHSA
jgi:hypothetical protein